MCALADRRRLEERMKNDPTATDSRSPQTSFDGAKGVSVPVRDRSESLWP